MELEASFLSVWWCGAFFRHSLLASRPAAYEKTLAYRHSKRGGHLGILLLGALLLLLLMAPKNH